jgi:hypothetical protein
MRIRSIIPLALLVIVALMTAFLLYGDAKPSVRVAPMDSVGPRPVETQTQASVVRDYLKAWETLGSALSENRVDLLDSYFVGIAKDKLTDTIHEQKQLGIETSYRPKSHDMQVVFYSPEGLSIQLVDNVEYDVEVRDHGKAVGTEHVRTRYVAVLTPTESKWKVRVFQSGDRTN